MNTNNSNLIANNNRLLNPIINSTTQTTPSGTSANGSLSNLDQASSLNNQYSQPQYTNMQTSQQQSQQMGYPSQHYNPNSASANSTSAAANSANSAYQNQQSIHHLQSHHHQQQQQQLMNQTNQSGYNSVGNYLIMPSNNLNMY